jgi:hypothetical protein
MTISKLHVVARNDALGLQLEAAKSGLSGCSNEPAGPTISDGVKLIEAFRRISDPDRRKWLLKQAERLASPA